MQTFACQCGNRLFFENTLCVSCHREVGWCECCRQLSSLSSIADDLYICDGCGETLQKCHNYAIEQVCNRLYRASAENQPPTLCSVCQLSETIPDLSISGNREKWARLEQAKRRLIYQLDLLGLPYQDVDPPLSFDFKGHVIVEHEVLRKGESTEHVYTGHSNGKITINIQEADDVEREKMRIDMHEAHRTLIGHFRHEVGHYYWQLLIQEKLENETKALFGDHEQPDYATALAQYYQNGPDPDWNFYYVSAYASAHPWEDFAETFALYLDIRSVIDTAQHLKIPLPQTEQNSAESFVIAYQKLGIIVNELNRCMGIFDLVPEVLVAPVVEKLAFIHDLVLNSAPKPSP